MEGFVQKTTLYLILLSIAAVGFGIGFVLVLTLLNPTHLLNLVLFYLILAGFSFSVFTLVGVNLRKMLGLREMVNQYLGTSMRQGIWLTIILIVSLILLSHNLFTWLNAGFLILAIVFFESYLATKNR